MQIIRSNDAQTIERPMSPGAATSRLQDMHCVTLITRPARAAGLVVTVGLLLGVQSTLALGAAGAAGRYALIVALAAATIALGVFAPLHSRSGSIAVMRSRAPASSSRSFRLRARSRSAPVDLAAVPRRGPLHRCSRHGASRSRPTPRGRHLGAPARVDAGLHAARDPVRAGRRLPRRQVSSGSPSGRCSGVRTRRRQACATG